MADEIKIKMDTLKMSQLEKDLYRLAMITGRFQHVYSELPKMPEGDAFYSSKSAFREYAIIQLHNFLHIRDSIRRDLKEIGKEIVDISLRPFWEPIHEQREAIKQLRDEYLAHLQENAGMQFIRTIEQILHDSKFAGSWNDICYYAGCVLQYSKFIECNFYNEWHTAMGKYASFILTNQVEVLFERTDINHIQNVKLDLKKATSEVIDNLKNNSLNY